MPITRLNHAVLYVRDVERSVAFYRDVLGFRVLNVLPDGFSGAAFLQAPGSTNDHDLGLFEIGSAAAASPAGRGIAHCAMSGGAQADGRHRSATGSTATRAAGRPRSSSRARATAASRSGARVPGPGPAAAASVSSTPRRTEAVGPSRPATAA